MEEADRQGRDTKGEGDEDEDELIELEEEEGLEARVNKAEKAPIKEEVWHIRLIMSPSGHGASTASRGRQKVIRTGGGR